MSPRRSRGASHRETKASKQSVSTAPRERRRRDHPAQPQAPDQRDVCASLARHALDDALPAWRTSVGPRHGQVKAGLVGKNKPPALQRCHPLAEGLTVGLHLLGRRQTFFYGAAPAAATPGRRSPGGLRLWLYASGSSPTPRGWRPGLGAPARATARAACRATRRDSRRRVTVARGSPRRDTFGAGGSPSDVRLRRCLPLHRVCLRRPRRRELFSRGGQLSKPSWPMSVATHSANASANRNREEITRRGVDPRLAHFVVNQGAPSRSNMNDLSREERAEFSELWRSGSWVMRSTTESEAQPREVSEGTRSSPSSLTRRETPAASRSSAPRNRPLTGPVAR